MTKIIDEIVTWLFVPFYMLGVGLFAMLYIVTLPFKREDREKAFRKRKEARK